MSKHKHRTDLNKLGASDIERWRELEEEFVAANMSGRPGGESGKGQLNNDWYALMMNHVARGGVDYTIYSYWTPIAWYTPRGWVIVDQSFSQSTSRHQAIVRQLHPRRADIWCTGEGRDIIPPREGDTRPSDVRGRWGHCPTCEHLVNGKHGATSRHLSVTALVSR